MPEVLVKSAHFPKFWIIPDEYEAFLYLLNKSENPLTLTLSHQGRGD
jgi:hypothetical protein